MVTKIRTVFFFLALASCGGLSSESKKDIENAAKTSAAAYRYADAETPAGALIRASFCANAAVIRNENLEPVDGGSIQCQ